MDLAGLVAVTDSLGKRSRLAQLRSQVMFHVNLLEKLPEKGTAKDVVTAHLDRLTKDLASLEQSRQDGRSLRLSAFNFLGFLAAFVISLIFAPAARHAGGVWWNAVGDSLYFFAAIAGL